MLYITIDTGAERESWDLRVYERVMNGLKHLEKEGFTVERFDKFDEKTALKKIITITRAE